MQMLLGPKYPKGDVYRVLLHFEGHCLLRERLAASGAG